MGVIHILKDGSRTNDVSGRVVRMEEARTLYRVIDGINLRQSDKKQTIKHKT